MDAGSPGGGARLVQFPQTMGDEKDVMHAGSDGEGKGQAQELELQKMDPANRLGRV
jgi:hypothetical protein